MGQLVGEIGLSNREENTIRGELNTWATNGIIWEINTCKPYKNQYNFIDIFLILFFSNSGQHMVLNTGHF